MTTPSPNIPGFLSLDRKLNGMIGTQRGPDLKEMELWAGREWDSVIVREYSIEAVEKWPRVVPVFNGGRLN